MSPWWRKSKDENKKEKHTKGKKATEFEKAKFHVILEGNVVLLMFREEGFRATEFWVRLNSEELTKLINTLIGVEDELSNI